MRIFTKWVPLALVLLSAGTAGATTFTVLVGQNGENQYQPATLAIKTGDLVEFKYGSGVHPTTSDSSPAAWVAFIPSTAAPSKIVGPFAVGTYPYHCTSHGVPGPPSETNMSGVITVTASGLATAPPALAGSLNIFPNPSRGLVSATLNGRAGGSYQLRLRNIIGQNVRTVTLRPELTGAAQIIDFSDLPVGLYLYSLLVDNKAVLTKRLTLQ